MPGPALLRCPLFSAVFREAEATCFSWLGPRFPGAVGAHVGSGFRFGPMVPEKVPDLSSLAGSGGRGMGPGDRLSCMRRQVSGSGTGSEKNVEAKTQPRTTATPSPSLAKFLQSPATVPAPFQASGPQGVTAFIEAVCPLHLKREVKAKCTAQGRFTYLVPRGLGPGRPSQAMPATCSGPAPPPTSQREGTVSAGAGPGCPHCKGTVPDGGWRRTRSVTDSL